MAASVSLSSASGQSAALQLDYYASKGVTLAARFGSSTSSAAFSIQVSLDDPMLTSSAAMQWFYLSSSPVTYTSSTNFDTLPAIQVLTPIAAARLNSTGLSSGTITLKALQNAGG
jgi:hypothetical protein